MARAKYLARLMLGCILLGLIGWVLYRFAIGFWSGFVQLDKSVVTAIAGVLGTILVSLFTLVWSKRAEQKREIEQELRKQKVPIYEELLEFIFKFVWGDKLGGVPTPDESVKFYAALTPKLIVWASDEVVKTFGNFRKSSVTGVNPAVTAVMVEGIMYAMRKDLGHKNRDLKTGSLLSLFVNDIDEFLNK